MRHKKTNITKKDAVWLSLYNHYIIGGDNALQEQYDLIEKDGDDVIKSWTDEFKSYDIKSHFIKSMIKRLNKADSFVSDEGIIDVNFAKK